jgi:hypothetical protein
VPVTARCGEDLMPRPDLGQRLGLPIRPTARSSAQGGAATPRLRPATVQPALQVPPVLARSGVMQDGIADAEQLVHRAPAKLPRVTTATGRPTRFRAASTSPSPSWPGGGVAAKIHESEDARRGRRAMLRALYGNCAGTGTRQAVQSTGGARRPCRAGRGQRVVAGWPRAS